ncbi:sarcosine oxidase [Xylariomycetidae sp. FL2044]|nr:sarcosine oxidase [Xylariomycetidae sp. FL2044]
MSATTTTTATTSPEKADYLIVGGGVFGTSTAYHLKKQHPEARIQLVDRDHPLTSATRVAASWDWNKAVRADYADPLYCRLALEAQDVWRADPLWRPFYHETGIYWISRTDVARRVVDNFERLGRRGDGVDIASVPVAEARKLYGGVFDHADYTGVESVLVNRSSGWGEAKDALRRVSEEAVALGVEVVVAEVDGLLLADDDDGACVGVRAADGREFRADKVILSTGSFTPKLLEMTADRTGRDALRVGDRILAAGVTTGLVNLDDETMERFKGMPVGIQENPPERGASNGSLPPNKAKQLKWWGQYIFKNTQTLPSGKRISAPPPFPDYDQWNVPEELKKDIEFANRITFGKLGESWKIEQHRLCWDAVTPSEDFIISPHPASEGLYLATCGSFHGWKFFPILGAYVSKMLDGTLEPELVGRWAWDREIPAVDARKHKWWPRHELEDLKG